jgi:hypothetical protein
VFHLPNSADQMEFCITELTLNQLQWAQIFLKTELLLSWLTNVTTHTAAKIRWCDYLPTESAWQLIQVLPNYDHRFTCMSLKTFTRLTERYPPLSENIFKVTRIMWKKGCKTTYMNGTCLTRPRKTNTRPKRKFISHSNKNIPFMENIQRVVKLLFSQ